MKLEFKCSMTSSIRPWVRLMTSPEYSLPETSSVTRATASGHLSGDGEFTRACHASLEQSLGVPAALLTTSCTHALEMAALLLRIAPGDEVILPSFTFVSTANAFVLRGARPVFADIHPDTLNLDESRLEGLLTPRTRAKNSCPRSHPLAVTSTLAALQLKLAFCATIPAT